MKIFKLFLTLILSAILIAVLPASSHAVDLTVTCQENGPCDTSPSSGAALFFETNWLPGDSVNRNVTVINQDGNESCNLTLDTKNETQSPADFATRLFTVIKNGGSDIFGIRNGSTAASSNRNLNDLYGFGPISLGSIAANSTQSFDWAVTFDTSAGNEFQNAQTVFDFDLVFSCDGVSSSTPSPTLSPAGPPTSGGGGTVLGAVSQTLSRIFRPVRGTFEEEIIEVTPTPEPEVKGEETTVPEICGEYFVWWIPLLVQAVLTLVYVLYLIAKRKDDPQFKRFMVAPLVMAVLSQVAHFIIGCPCVDTVWCKWYWAFNLFIFMASAIFYRLFIYKDKKPEYIQDSQ